jgi:ABC-2 type transport system permease protein
LPLLAFFVLLLVMGWAVGLAIIAVILRNGLGAENLAWVAIFVLSPVSGIYYPISVLPSWLQPVAWSLPTSYVFEGMRAVMFEHVFRWDYLVRAAALDVLYIALGGAFLLWSFHRVRRTGALLQMGE